MGFFAFFGSLMIGGIMGVLFEKWGITRNGVIPSILLALGAVIVLFMIRVMFHLSFGSPGIDAIIGASAALVLLPVRGVWHRDGRAIRRDRRR